LHRPARRRRFVARNRQVEAADERILIAYRNRFAGGERRRDQRAEDGTRED
jgi:hypothetical protein